MGYFIARFEKVTEANEWTPEAIFLHLWEALKKGCGTEANVQGKGNVARRSPVSVECVEMGEMLFHGAAKKGLNRPDHVHLLQYFETHNTSKTTTGHSDAHT